MRRLPVSVCTGLLLLIGPLQAWGLEIPVSSASPQNSPTPNNAPRSNAQYYPYQPLPQASNSGPRILTPTPAPPPIQGTAAAPNPALPQDVVVLTTGVEVVGVSPELQQVVRNTIQTRPGGGTSQSQLQRDVDAILATGLFTKAQVSSRTTSEGLSVKFQVQPVIVRSLQLVGAQVLSPELVGQAFQNQVGKPVSVTAFNQAAERINQWYGQQGYSLGRVIAIRPSPEGLVTVEVAEGIIGQIKIQFLNEAGKATNDQGKPIQGRTQEAFIRRLLQLKPGQIFRDTVARQDIQNLYKLGLFNQVNIGLGGTVRRVDLTYNLGEITARAANFGAGYSEDRGLYGVINFSDRNFSGLGQQLATDLQIGSRDVQFNTTFTDPYRTLEPDRWGYRANIFRRRGLSDVFDEDILLPTGEQAREGRFGGSFTLNRNWNDWQTSIGLNYTRVSIRDRDGNLAPVDERGNPLTWSQTGLDDLTTISLSAVQDQRDTILDYARGGSRLSLSSEQSLPLGVGNILMNRLQANYAFFLPVNFLNAGDADQPEVLAINVQGGTTVGNLPPYNAFNLGGPNSVRGYNLGAVGSGRSYILASTEYRFPLLTWDKDNPELGGWLAGTVFTDFASDLGSGSTVLGEPAIARGKPGTGFGYGAGVQVRVPFIGILRADLGFNNHGESRLQFGFGQRF